MYQSLPLSTIRFSFAASIALTITFFLFFLMQYMIETTGKAGLDESEPVYFLDFIRLIEEPTIKPLSETEKLPKPLDPPPDFIIDNNTSNNQENTITGLPPADDKYIPTGENTFSPTINTELIPIVDMQPVYPRRAVSGNIEGFVVVEFTVTSSGTTDAIRVIDAEPENVFNRSAIKAASKSKYRPRIVEGKAVKVPGMRRMYSFELKD